MIPIVRFKHELSNGRRTPGSCDRPSDSLQQSSKSRPGDANETDGTVCDAARRDIRFLPTTGSGQASHDRRYQQRVDRRAHAAGTPRSDQGWLHHRADHDGWR